MPTTTTNYGLNKPLINNATDQDLWGGYLNGDLDNVDTLLMTAFSWTTPSETNNFTVTAPTTGSTTTGSAKQFYLCNCASNTIAVTLPAASTCAYMAVAFKKMDSTANAVTLTPNGADTIDGAASFAISTQYNWVVIVSDGSKWNIISQTAPSVIITTPLVRQMAFLSSGNFTAPSYTTSSTVFKLTLTAGGGGGGGANNGAGSGGAAGSTAIYYVTGLTANATYAITIGAGGVGGAGNANGATGGASTAVFGATTVTAPGGGGGAVGNGGLGETGGASGGACTNATISIPGGGGQNATSGTASGMGGSSMWGGGGNSVVNSNGVAGNAPGSGGSGAYSAGAASGGPGAKGLCLIEWIG